ncbi:hypothetical protein IFM53868_00962 [Aspergillus udagawae]|uniref:Uncharacterized protein n=1 Tax=Aspergillus udagawae TaxID=91492 RepID=A0ABQ1A459_9EURO|nr:hypothetical protein IFM53868_00962 [Aspergillus udagawae]GFG18347.1 hypothetical protein IFM5058_08977 [Aspergillus udagawae]
MAVLQKENRHRGLRVPSLSAFKSKKAVDHESAPAPAPVSAAPAPPAPVAPPQYPVRTDSAPVRPARPQNDKELPPSPLPSFPPASASLGPEDIHPAFRNEIPAARHHNYAPPARARDGLPVHIPTQQTPSNSVPPDAGDPLEDFIPDPEPEPEHEPELDGASGRLGSVSSDENNGPFTPPEIEPVTVPLNRLHYACFQEHRSMMPANNVWYSLPCMACQKFDREMRYRCVFCCLRICADCYQGLQKVPNRSLARLMETTPANS